jgi:hypothetical protein
MAATPLVPVVDREHAVLADGPAAEIDIHDFQEARADPEVAALLKEAAAEGTRVKHEGRKRW